MKRSGSPSTVTAERRARVWASLACLVGLLALAAAATAGAPGWSKPVPLAGGGLEPGVVLTGDGGAAAIWEAQGEHFIEIEGSIRVGGSWKLTSALAIMGFEPAIAPLGEGRAIAIWDGGSGVEGAIATTAGWSPVPPISDTFGAIAPEVATDGAGGATVVWRGPGPDGVTIDVATLAPGGEWSAVQPLSRPGRGPGHGRRRFAYSPRIAVAPTGAAVAVWRRGDGDKSIVQAAVRDLSGRWSAAVDLSAKGENAVAPAVAIGPDGEAVAVWHRFDGGHQIIQAATHRPGGSWSRPVDLSARGRNAEEPQVAISPGGEAVAVWERFDGRIDRIQAATRAPGGRWSRPRNLSSRGRSAHEPSLAVDAEGGARVVWMAGERRGPGVDEASRPAAGNWSAPVRIAPGHGRHREATIAAGPRGEAVALWAGDGIVAAFHPALPPAP